nr:PAAR domain-containing protein [Nevskia sp.]
MPLSISDALAQADRASTLGELKAIASKVSAAADSDNILLYSRVSPGAKAQAAADTGFSLIDNTARAELLQDERFIARIGKICGLDGIPGTSDADIVKMVNQAGKLASGHPYKAAATKANNALYGSEGDARSLVSSFWGEASKEFVESAKGSIIVMLGAPVEKVFWAVELPAVLANPGTRTINGEAAAKLATVPATAFAEIAPTAGALANAFNAKAAAPGGVSSASAAGSAASSGGSGSGGGGGGGGGMPAARIGDMHVCPMVTGVVPHVGGPISLGCPTVLIGGMPAACVGDLAVCVGPPDTIALGSFKVLIGGKPAARLGDMTAHGGAVIVGMPTVLIS